MKMMHETKKRRQQQECEPSTQESKPKSSKKLRRMNFESNISKKARRDPKNIKKQEITVPAKFNNHFDIKGFRKKDTLEYLKREVIANGGDIDNESSTQIILKEKLAALVLLNDRGIEQSLIDNAMKPDKSHQRWTALLSLFGKETTILLKDKDNIENIDELYNVSSKK